MKRRIKIYYTDVPGKPRPPEIETTGRTSAGLLWKPPREDGGSPIYNYVIEYRAEGAYKWKRSNQDTMPALDYTVGGLEEGIVYEFRVAAENRAGVGPASDPSAPTQIKEKLGESQPPPRPRPQPHLKP